MAELIRLTENTAAAGSHLQEIDSPDSVKAWETVVQCLDGIRDVLEAAEEVTKGKVPRSEQGLEQVRP